MSPAAKAEAKATSEVEVLRPSEVNLFHKNPRIGDIDAIKGSLRANGQYKPVLLNRGTHTGRPNEILAGNHTVKAIRNLAEEYPDDERWQGVQCWVVDVDDDRAARIVAADNRTSQLGSMDDKVLVDLLKDLPGLDGTAYAQDDFDDLRALLEEDESKDDVVDPDLSGPEDEGEYSNGLSNNNHSLESLKEGYESSGSRMLMLAYPLPIFVWVQQHLETIADELGVESNADAITAMISNHVNEPIPEIPADAEIDAEPADVVPDDAAIDGTATEEFPTDDDQ